MQPHLRVLADLESSRVGEEPPPITCPGDLDAEVGESITCTLTDDTGTYDVVVTVNSIENGTADLDIQVADAPNP